jgi:GNAT superfamily N-acetyltransferase
MLTLAHTAPIATRPDVGLQAAAGILAGAFIDTPLARYCFADRGGDLAGVVRAYARLACARHLGAGGAHLGAYHDGQLVGVAGVRPPAPGPLPAVPRAHWRWFAAVVGLRAVERIEQVERVIARYRPAEPHCTLGAFGVLPVAGGRGAGGALLAAVHAYAASRPATAGVYAVATVPDSAAFFARAGYRVVGQETLGGLTIACLFR